MGKAGSKLSAESLDRLKQSFTSTTNNNSNSNSNSINNISNSNSNNNNPLTTSSYSSSNTHVVDNDSSTNGNSNSNNNYVHASTAASNTNNQSFNGRTQTASTNTPFGLINEDELRDLCKNFNRDYPDAQLTDVLANEDLLAPFLTSIFYQEVEKSDSMQTLFRGNCLASKIMSHCFRLYGSTYLRHLLEPHIKSLTTASTTSTSSSINQTPTHSSKQSSTLNSPARSSRLSVESNSSDHLENTAQVTNHDIKTSTATSLRRLSHENAENSGDLTPGGHCSPISSNISYEIDSTKLKDDADIDANQKNLLKLTGQILDSILSSAPDFPPQLNSMCICLRQVLAQKYHNPSANLTAVGTVIFLRFINPAIVSPYDAGIVDQPLSPRTMRGLMLVSKILQNIANNVEFSKEEHMLPFNDFVRAQFEPLRSWVTEISSEKEDDNH